MLPTFFLRYPVPVKRYFKFIQNINSIFFKMDRVPAHFNQIGLNNDAAEAMLKSLKSELSAIRKELAARKKSELIKANNELLDIIRGCKSQLILLETKNGKRQISVPNQDDCSGVKTISPEAKIELNKEQSSTDETKPPKEKKTKKEKPEKQPPAAEAPIDVGRLDMRVGKIIDVSLHPDADSLYLEKIDCGEPNPRTVISGLVKYVPIDQMKNRMVVVLCNLKPAKMRGITSEAMVMCASTPEKVEVLSPPTGSAPGDLVFCDGYERTPDAQLNPKKKIFETCAPDLKTNNELVACFKDKALKTDKGFIVSQTLKNVNVK